MGETRLQKQGDPQEGVVSSVRGCGQAREGESTDKGL